MSLITYQHKRKFNKTPEPSGQIQKLSQNRFVVGEYHASHLHWDFRLELSDSPAGGEIVLKSWAVPKGPPQKVGEKRLAVAVEDNPVDDINFDGVIHEGQYGAGTVKIWDKGSFELISRTDHELKFILHGQKLSGPYTLVNFRPPKNWLLIKEKK